MAGIIEGHSVRTSRNDPDQNARMHMLIYNFACSAFYRTCVTLCRKDQINFWILAGIPVKNTGIPVKTPILALIKKQIYSEDDPEKPRGQFPYSPKLVSFPCSLRPLIWVYAVCIGLSVPIFRFFKFLIRAGFVCISDENRLYKIRLFFSQRSFPPRFHVTYRYEHVVS